MGKEIDHSKMPREFDPSSVIKLMRSHRSVRDFKSDPVPDEITREIIHSARWASTTHYRQTYSVIAIKHQDKKESLWQLCGRQRWIKECPLFFVFCADMNRLDFICRQHNKRVNLQHTETFLMAILDVGLFMQNAALAAESFDLGIVMIGGIRDRMRQVIELLELPYGVFPVSGMCVGYPKQDSKQSPRLPLDEVLYWETYQPEGRSTRLDEYDQQVIKASVYSPKNGKRRGWSEAMAANTSKPPREGTRINIREIVKEQGFELR